MKLDASPANRRRRACSLTSSTPILPSLTKRSHARLHPAPARTKWVTVSRASVENSLDISTFNYLKHDATLPPKYPTPDTWRTVERCPARPLTASIRQKCVESVEIVEKLTAASRIMNNFHLFRQIRRSRHLHAFTEVVTCHSRRLAVISRTAATSRAVQQPNGSQSTRCISSTEITDTRHATPRIIRSGHPGF